MNSSGSNVVIFRVQPSCLTLGLPDTLMTELYPTFSPGFRSRGTAWSLSSEMQILKANQGGRGGKAVVVRSTSLLNMISIAGPSHGASLQMACPRVSGSAGGDGDGLAGPAAGAIGLRYPEQTKHTETSMVLVRTAIDLPRPELRGPLQSERGP
jgi:hypothetical protein